MNTFVLPEGYSLIKKINLEKDKKLKRSISLCSCILVILLFLIGLCICPFHYLVKAARTPLLLIVPVLAIFAVILFCGLIHILFINLFSGKKITYGLTLSFVYVGSDSYFNKHQYIITAIVPILFFGFLFLLLNIFLPLEWFWSIYLLQIFNISGSVGNMYVIYATCKLPPDTLVHDTGLTMEMYSRNIKH